jgi:hypothetical protein
MAQSDFLGELLTIGLVGVGGYLIYSAWSTSSTSAAAAPAVTGAPAAPPTPPAYTYTPPTPLAQLQTAAQTNSIVMAQGGQADAYQWATIYDGIAGLPSIASVNINGTFFPSGLPSNQTALANTPNYSQQGLPLMTAAVFLQGIQAAGVTGLSGLGQAGPKYVSVPIMIAKQKFALTLPAGTTPAQFQAQLRRYAR